MMTFVNQIMSLCFLIFVLQFNFVKILQLGFNEKILLCIQFLSNYFPKLKIFLTFIIYIYSFNAHFLKTFARAW
jgi:hypothetical protein